MENGSFIDGLPGFTYQKWWFWSMAMLVMTRGYILYHPLSQCRKGIHHGSTWQGFQRRMEAEGTQAHSASTHPAHQLLAGAMGHREFGENGWYLPIMYLIVSLYLVCMNVKWCLAIMYLIASDCICVSSMCVWIYDNVCVYVCMHGIFPLMNNQWIHGL